MWHTEDYLQSRLRTTRHLCFACAPENFMYEITWSTAFSVIRVLWARWRKTRRVIARVGRNVSSAFFYLSWKGFVPSTSNEKEARKVYNPEKGITIFVCKYRCKHLFCTCVKTRLHGRFFVAIFLILTHAIEWLSHKSIDFYYSFAQMV